MNVNLIELLKVHLKELTNAAAILTLSYDKCSSISIEPGLDNDQLESLEALTARFARLSDLFIQKALRTLGAMDLEDSGTVRDRINRAEKKGIVKSAEKLVKIRMLRNEIAHEYKPETILEIFGNVIALTPDLLKAVDKFSQVATSYVEENEMVE